MTSPWLHGLLYQEYWLLVNKVVAKVSETQNSKDSTLKHQERALATFLKRDQKQDSKF